MHMIKYFFRSRLYFIIWITAFVFCSCAPEKNPLSFKQEQIVSEGAEYWWARNHTHINTDDLLDFFVINDNAHGGKLGWYEANSELKSFKFHEIAATGPNGGSFACGDLVSGDIDQDGDIDVLGPVSPGEWGGSSEPTEMYWYENPDWQPHYIGQFPNFIKDLDLVDLNRDGKLDLAGTCFDSHRMIVFRQDEPDKWVKATDVFVETLHEGQDVGDVDGDGDIDVVSTAFWFQNPGGDMTGNWAVNNIDSYWNSDQGETWEYNATKIYCADIDNDDMDEVFISCSEKFRDRVAWYDLEDPAQNKWTMHQIGTNTFAHTLQVGDLDADGDLDVLSGNNGDQGEPNQSPVKVFLNNGDNLSWTEMVLTNTGAYNSYLEDFEGDGDLDFFRYDGHEGDSYEVWINNTFSD